MLIDRGELGKVSHVLSPEPVVGECVLVPVGVEEGGHVPVHRLHTVQLAIADFFISQFSNGIQYYIRGSDCKSLLTECLFSYQ